jgi:hypothetical protein
MARRMPAFMHHPVYFIRDSPQRTRESDRAAGGYGRLADAELPQQLVDGPVAHAARVGGS